MEESWGKEKEGQKMSGKEKVEIRVESGKEVQKRSVSKAGNKGKVRRKSGR